MLTHGTDSITGQLVVLFNSIWREQEVPDDWKKGIVKLPKKGNLSDCNNWRGITLLSTPGKVLTRALLNRLQNAVDQTLREEQAAFRKGRSCTERGGCTLYSDTLYSDKRYSDTRYSDT